MTIEDTYNIHKKINCCFPKFKSKWLCKKNIHNYRIHPRKENKRWVNWNWKCYCCGKEIETID